jgi:hypothetical protein
MTAQPAYTEERRNRLSAALVGARGNEMVSVRINDLRACFLVAETVTTAQELIGENARLRAAYEASRKLADAHPGLCDRIVALNGHVATLQGRLDLAGRIIRGEAP